MEDCPFVSVVRYTQEPMRAIPFAHGGRPRKAHHWDALEGPSLRQPRALYASNHASSEMGNKLHMRSGRETKAASGLQKEETNHNPENPENPEDPKMES